MKRCLVYGTLLATLAVLLLSCAPDESERETELPPVPPAAGSEQTIDLVGEVAFVEGSARRIRPDHDATDVVLGDAVAALDRIETDDDGSVEVTSEGVGRLLIRPSTTVIFGPAGSTFQMNLREGGILVRAGGLASGRSLEIATPTLQAGVRGTEFEVTHDPESDTSIVSVVEGSVVILPPGVRTSTLSAALGDEPELLDRVRSTLQETGVVLREGEEIVIGPNQREELEEVAGSILEIVRSLPGASPESVEARIEELGALNRSTAQFLEPTGAQEQPSTEPPPSAPPIAQSEPPTPSDPSIGVGAAERAYVEAMSYSVDRRIAAMYYPWYRNPETDSLYVGWDDWGADPPATWASDFEPMLGLYSSNDPDVREQHMQWIRRAGIGTIVVPWFGPGEDSSELVELFDLAARYEVDIALRVEGDASERPSLLPRWIDYLLREFATRPNYAHLRSSVDADTRPLVFVFSPPAPFDRWFDRLETVRTQPEYPALVAAGFDPLAVTEGGFDGLALLAIPRATESSYASGRLLPPAALFVPSLTPGFARYAEVENRTLRFGGLQMDRQVAWALNSSAPPAMLLLTSFNRWDEGTQIEPAVESDRAPLDYGSLGPLGYLDKMRETAREFLEWNPAPRTRLRFVVRSTSDFAELRLDRVSWGGAVIVEATDPPASEFFNPDTNMFVSEQPLQRAEEGGSVSHTFEISVPVAEVFEFGLVKGGLGTTSVEVYRVEEVGVLTLLREFERGETLGLDVTWFEVQVQ